MTKKHENLYLENYKTLFTKIKEDLNNERCTMFVDQKTYITKMLVSPKLSAILIRVTAVFFIEIDKMILKCRNCKRTNVTNTTSKKKTVLGLNTVWF